MVFVIADSYYSIRKEASVAVLTVQREQVCEVDRQEVYMIAFVDSNWDEDGQIPTLPENGQK